MANLTVRNVDDNLARDLRVRAAINGRSTEAEIREIIRLALRPPDVRSFKAHLLAMPHFEDDVLFERIQGDMRAVEL